MQRACLLLQALQHEPMANKVLATSVSEVRYFLVCEKNMWSLTVGMELRNAYRRCKNHARELLGKHLEKCHGHFF